MPRLPQSWVVSAYAKKIPDNQPATLQNAQNHEGHVILRRGFTREPVDSLRNGDTKVAWRSIFACSYSSHEAFNSPLFARGVLGFDKTVCVGDDHIGRVECDRTNVVNTSREHANRRTAAVKPLNH